MKTRKDIEVLKANWLRDPCWDVEGTEGFEAHHVTSCWHSATAPTRDGRPPKRRAKRRSTPRPIGSGCTACCAWCGDWRRRSGGRPRRSST